MIRPRPAGSAHAGGEPDGLYQGKDEGYQIAAHGAAALSRVPVARPPAGVRDRLARLRAAGHRARHWIEDSEFVVDLGVRIGSRQWIRGAMTCFGLCATAWSLAPDFKPIEGLHPAPLPEAQWQEARALAITPLAYGADTGRRMGATALVEPLGETPDRPRVEVSAALGRGDGFERALRRAGVSDEDAARAADLVAGAIPLSDLDGGSRMDLVLGRRATKEDPRPLDRLSFRARLDLALLLERPKAGAPIRLVRTDIAVDDTPLRIRGEIGDSFYRAARAAGAPPRAIEGWLRAMGSGRRYGASDRFDMIVKQRRAETGEVILGELVYAGLERRGAQVQMLKWDKDGRSQWFEGNGAGETKGTLQRPVMGRQTSSFGMRRHPLLGYSRFHKGIDYGAASGTPIMAASDGTVVFSGWHGGHGNYVKLNHAGGLATAYAHMSRIAVRNGARVRQGQVIGYVGSTGLSTGPHLHYEIYKNGAAVNPGAISFKTQIRLAGAELGHFKAELGRYLAVPVNAAPRFARKGKAEAVAKADKAEKGRRG